MTLKAPYPYFGGKSAVADLVWERLGDVTNFVEPFFGSGAVLLARPADHVGRIETANDKDGFIANFWRAVQADPEAVAHYADWPVNENDLHARHAWLLNHGRGIVARLEGDPDFFDAKVAGWWVWGMSCWIGSGWCSGVGPWRVVDGELVRAGANGVAAWRQLPHLGDAGMGIHAGVARYALVETMHALGERLHRVRVCSGDWRRVCGPSVTTKHGLTGVFLDPPYAHEGRDAALYREEMAVTDDVRAWAIDHGDDPLMRIALCGYAGEHAMPNDWTAVAWKARGGYGSQSDGAGRANAARETIWFSPHCLRPESAALPLFAALEVAS